VTVEMDGDSSCCRKMNTEQAMSNTQNAVLIFQIGSMGDTVISIPCYREIARRHPGVKLYLLTNHPIGAKMVPAEAILSATGLITGSIGYPMPLRGKKAIVELYHKLVALGATTLYYLTPETKLNRLIRHYIFFRTCGITTIHGVPWSRDLQYPREIASKGIWESEASRLLRCISAQKEAGRPPTLDRDLNLSVQEKATAICAIREGIGSGRYIAISVGGKIPVKEWGDRNWLELLTRLSSEYPGLGALFVGSADERERNSILAKAWAGPSLNSCGLFSPRETAALIDQASLFIGHDTGTLHLAGAVNTRIIGIYCARDVPGKWFSDRPEDTFFYNRLECFNCGCIEAAECPNDMRCIMSTSPEQVLAAAKQHLV
jgi:heptosyltransferase III